MEEVIKVSNLSKAYGGVPVLKALNLTVGAGEVFGLLGENGAGKTTAIECMLGTRPADSGLVRILGLDPCRERRRLFEQVGVQFQEANYPDRIKVRELCRETACLYRNAADYHKLAAEFGLSSQQNAYVSTLSGGQKQKLFILLALLAKPQVVFLDELTTGLDLRARRSVWQSLLALKEQGLTIFLSSHYMDEVEILCDRIGILRDGGFAFYGSLQEALKQSGSGSLAEAYLWFTGEGAREDA